MMYELRMPDLTTNDAPVRIVRWIVQPGAQIERGQPLLEAETDKAVTEVEAAVSGRLHQTLCQAGDDVQVGETIALVELSEASRPESGAPGGAEVPGRSDPLPAAARPGPPPTPAAEPGAPVGLFARNRAARASQPPATAPGDLTAAHRTMARRMQSSKQTVPHFYLQASCNAERLVAQRQAAGPDELVWDAFFVRAAAVAIQRFDRFRRRWEGGGLIDAPTDAIGLAIDVQDDLFVVAIENAAGKSVEQLSDEIREAARRLAAGDQETRRLRPALMTVTNLGGCAVERFMPIINPPEPAILGVGRVMLTPAVLPDGQIVAQHRCTVTLCVDHRVASGKYAARFLEAIIQELER